MRLDRYVDQALDTIGLARSDVDHQTLAAIRVRLLTADLRGQALTGGAGPGGGDRAGLSLIAGAARHRGGTS